MIEPFVITQFCTSPGLIWPVPAGLILTGSEPVAFSMWDRQTHALKIDDRPGLHVTYAGAPALAYPWDVADTDVFGDFEGQFIVTLGSGHPEAVPNGFRLPIRIEEAIQ